MILHVIPGLGTGGAEHALASLVTAKRPNAPEQAVVDLIGGGDLTPAIRAAGVPVFELGMNNPATAPLALMKLRSLIRRLRPDAIQSWLYYADLMALWALELSGRRSATRLYWGIRCSSMEDSKSPILRWTIDACARRSAKPDAVIANSFAGRDEHSRMGYAPRAFPVLPNGIDTGRFRPDPAARSRVRATLAIADDETAVIHVARVHPMKDHETLIRTAAALPDIVFLAVGQSTEHLDAPPNLRKLGRRSDIAELFTAADLALSTSAYGEGFPNVLAEAMATEIPVIATDVGDAGIIVGPTGAIVAPRDAVATTEALRRMAAESVEQRLARGRASRERIERLFALAPFVTAFDALLVHGTLPEPANPHSRAA